MYLPSEEFNQVWHALRDDSRFSVLVADCNIVGAPFSTDAASYWQFDAVQAQGLAWRWIESAINNGVLEYTVTVNGVAFAFKTPFGWSTIPLKYYAWGRLPKDFRGMHACAVSFLQSVLEARDDDESG